MAKFYNQRVSGQGSVNNTSIYQAALRGESIQSSHLVALPPSRRHTHLGRWAGQPPRSCSLALPSGQKGTGSPKGLALLGDLSTLHFSVLGRNWGGSREGKWAGRGTFPTLHPPRAPRPQSAVTPLTTRHVSKPELTCFIRAPPPPRPRLGPHTPHRVVYVKRVSKGSRLRTRFGGLHL